MGFSFFLAKLLSLKGKYSGQVRVFIFLNIIAVSLSCIVLISTNSISNGFNKAIQEKISGFWGHIHIQTYQPNAKALSEEKEFTRSYTLENNIEQIDEVIYASAFATKYGLLFSKTEFEGVLFKGIEHKHQEQFVDNFLKTGSPIHFNDDNKAVYEIILPKIIAQKLDINVNDFVVCTFLYDNLTQRKRKLKVVGIFESGIEDFDEQFCIVDLRLIQKMNRWNENQIGGYEVLTKNVKTMLQTEKKIFDMLPDWGTSRTLADVFPEIFEWLKLVDANQYIIFGITVIISLINITTCLLILIVGRIKMISLLYSLGATRWQIQKTFIFLTIALSIFGLLIGNATSFTLLWLLKTYKWVRLETSAYITDTIPVEFNVIDILFINIGLILVMFITLILPSYFIKQKQIVRLLQLE